MKETMYQTRRMTDMPSMSKREIENGIILTNKRMLMKALVKKYGEQKALECFDDYFKKINQLGTDREKKDFIELVLGD